MPRYSWAVALTFHTSSPPHIKQGTRLAVALYVLLDAILALLAPAPAAQSMPTHAQGGLDPMPASLTSALAAPIVPVTAHDESGILATWFRTPMNCQPRPHQSSAPTH